MRNIKYIGTKATEDAFFDRTQIIWTPGKIDTVLDEAVATEMLRFAEFEDAGDAVAGAGVAVGALSVTTSGFQVAGQTPTPAQAAAVRAGMDVVSIVSPKSSTGAKVSFIFDDGYISARDVVAPLFESKGKRAGFSIPCVDIGSNDSVYLTLSDCVALQTSGHEIGSQTLNDTAMTTAGAVTDAVAEYEIRGSAAWWAERGIDARFFAAASSTLDSSYHGFLAPDYVYAFTVYAGGSWGSSGLQAENITDRYSLHRTSLYTLWAATDATEELRTLDRIKATIDAAVSEGRWVVFYDHDPSRVTVANSLPSALLEEVLDYCIAAGVEVVPPSVAIDTGQYTAVRSLRRQLFDRSVLDVWFTTATLTANVVTKIPTAASEVKSLAMTCANGVFTATTSGTFLFNACVNFEAAGQDMTGVRAFLSVRLNGGSTDVRRAVSRGVGTTIPVAGVMAVKMNAGDYAEVFAFQNGTGPISSTGGNPGYSACNVTYLGP